MAKSNDKKKKADRKVRGDRSRRAKKGTAARGRGPAPAADDPGSSAEVEELRARLAEAEETLRAIRSGEVDALVVSGPEGDRIYTLQGADEPYRVIIEQMQEGAVTVVPDGTILYCNRRFAEMLQQPLEKVIGQPLAPFLAPADRRAIAGALQDRFGRFEGSLLASNGETVPVQVTASAVGRDPAQLTGLVVTDLTARRREVEVLRAERLARSILENRPRRSWFAIRGATSSGQTTWPAASATATRWGSDLRLIFRFGRVEANAAGLRAGHGTKRMACRRVSRKRSEGRLSGIARWRSRGRIRRRRY